MVLQNERRQDNVRNHHKGKTERLNVHRKDAGTDPILCEQVLVDRVGLKALGHE